MAIKLVYLHPNVIVRGHTLNVDTDNLLCALEEARVRHVVNVALRPDDAFKHAAATVGMGYDHFPLSDSQGFFPETEIRRIIWKTTSRAAQYPILIHCDSGWNRSSLIAVPVVCLLLKASTKERVAEILRSARQLRPKILKNPSFEEFVLSGAWLKADDL